MGINPPYLHLDCSQQFGRVAKIRWATCFLHVGRTVVLRAIEAVGDHPAVTEVKVLGPLFAANHLHMRS
jgi:hypothetical protein